MKNVAELLLEKDYERIAERYFDWLVFQLGQMNFEKGLEVLAEKYNEWVFTGKPFALPANLNVETWLSDNAFLLYGATVRVTQDDIKGVKLYLEGVMKNRIEEKLHHQNPLNP